MLRYHETKTFSSVLWKSKSSRGTAFSFGMGTNMIRILEVDEFIAQLWQVHLKVKEDGYSQVGLGSSISLI